MRLNQRDQTQLWASLQRMPRLNPTEATKVAQMAHDGLTRVIRPVNTMFDGDTIFSLSLASLVTDVNTVGIVAVEVVAEAILRAVKLD
jgi:L-aminopeptidase/D-esterase-like protein